MTWGDLILGEIDTLGIDTCLRLTQGQKTDQHNTQEKTRTEQQG